MPSPPLRRCYSVLGPARRLMLCMRVDLDFAVAMFWGELYGCIRLAKRNQQTAGLLAIRYLK